jgi:hypothetical protein
MSVGDTVLSPFYPGELGRVVQSRPDGWLVVVWPCEPTVRCLMKAYAVTPI